MKAGLGVRLAGAAFLAGAFAAALGALAATFLAGAAFFAGAALVAGAAFLAGVFFAVAMVIFPLIGSKFGAEEQCVFSCVDATGESATFQAEFSFFYRG
jgi:hypothetical protein